MQGCLKDIGLVQEMTEGQPSEKKQWQQLLVGDYLSDEVATK